jgi:hypothetical protein
LKVCPGTINHWIYGEREPRIRNLFEVKPSPELSYIIGANIGDGSNLAKSGSVKLEVSDPVPQGSRRVGETKSWGV